MTLSISPQDRVYGASPGALPNPFVGAALTDDLIEDADTLLEAETLLLAEAWMLEAAALILDFPVFEGLAIDLALAVDVFEAWDEISDLADFDIALRLGDDIGIFEADDTLNVGVADLTTFEELGVNFAAELLEALEETADAE